MAAQGQRIAALEQQVADLAARLEQYHDAACVIRSLEDVLGGPLTAASRQAPQRPVRHLHAVPGPDPEPELEAGA
jgi:hypothetical protein